ncbi:MAG TPA: hypothetical protein VFM96_11185 [Gaiellaceae bacterium]|nr:hypothetical protein [Gaiellaceae bacterium]
MRLCSEAGGEVGFSFPERFEAVTVAADAVLEEVGCEPSVFEAFEVAFQLALDARDLGARRCQLFLQLGPLGLGHVREVGECSFDHMAVAIELGELGEHGRFEPVFGEPVGVALGGAVLVAGGAGVVGVAVVASVRAGADVGAPAMVAADEAGEEIVGRVAAPQRRVFVSAAEDLLRLVEGVVVDERLVQAGMCFAVPANKPAVSGVGEDELQRVGRPTCFAGRGCGLGLERARDRGRAELPVGVQAEDATDDRRLHFVRHKQLGLFVAGIAVGSAAAHPFAFADAAFKSGSDAVDDRRVLELGKHAEHLQHHPPRRGARVERLGRRLQDDVDLIEFLAQPRELTHLPREAVDAVDEQ